jgi:hypothetical protein
MDTGEEKRSSQAETSNEICPSSSEANPNGSFWTDRPRGKIFLAIIPAIPAFIIACFAWLQYEHNKAVFSILEWQQRPIVGVSTTLGPSGTLGMCLIPDVEYKYDGTCKPKQSDVFSYVKHTDAIRAFILVRNTGNSPAHSTVLKVHWCVSTNKPKAPPSFTECDGEQGKDEELWRDGPRVLFHGQGDSTLDVSATFRLSQSDIDSIRRHERYFYLRGQISYDWKSFSAGTSVPYRTEFCIIYDPRGHGEDFALYYCPSGNEAR